MLEMLKR